MDTPIAGVHPAVGDGRVDDDLGPLAAVQLAEGYAVAASSWRQAANPTTLNTEATVAIVPSSCHR